MKKLFQVILMLPWLGAAFAAEPATDTMVDVGSYKLHFHVIKGHGTPILFESGGGDDETVWHDLLPPLADLTQTTLIAYDRPGFGKSGLDTNRHSIKDNLDDLEKGLKALGYDGKLILVAHSLGGFYATLYAARHPDAVQGAVLVDANLVCFFTPEHVAANEQPNEALRMKFKDSRPGLSYLYGEITSTVALMRQTPFPTRIPLIDIVSDKTPFRNDADIQLWKSCHRQFADEANNRQGIVANDAGHYVYKANPALVINAIAKIYAATLPDRERLALLDRALGYNLDAANQARKQQAEYRHSEDDLNDWGYQLMARGEKQRAIDVFKLSVELHPASANVYDSLAESYEALGDKRQAIANYQHSLQLKPSNEHAKERLRVLQTAPN
ncbi:alpha/beta fold hydrolase [Dyella koreensis]|uniref:Alpha/beta fold hydrolase n=1 Tax=Dyella koreensis TaxID=311235 RepID=A0ABW8K3P5_9GAMM